MNFLRRLLGGAAPTNDGALHLYVRCNRCQSVVHVRVDLRNDLVSNYDDDEANGYTLYKEMMDSRCFRLMRAEIAFDRARRETGRTIEGGTFISREDYEQAQRQPPTGR